MNVVAQMRWLKRWVLFLRAHMSQGDGGDLEASTSLGNFTPNTIQVTDALNLNPGIQSTVLLNYGSSVNAGGLLVTDGDGLSRRVIEHSFETNETSIYNDNSSTAIVVKAEETDNIAAVSITGRLSILPGINSGDAATIGQLEAVTDTPNVVIGDEGLVGALVPGTAYTYVGTVPASWLLPPSNTAPGKRIFIVNMSDQTLAITANSPGDIYANGGDVDELTLTQGQTNVALDNSLRQVIIA